MNKQVKCMYDVNRFQKKPNNNVIGIVSTELVKPIEINIEELAKNVSAGASFKCSYLEGTKAKDWISSQLFGIDIDNKEEDVKRYGYLSSEDFLNQCKLYNTMPVFMYNTLSSSEETEKYRAVFMTENVITDIRLQRLIQLTLMKIFPQCDPACKDVTRLFLGGKRIIYENYDSTISPFNLLDTFITILKVKDSKSFSRSIQKHCKELGLNMINGNPDIKLCEKKSAETPLGQYIYYSRNAYPAFLEVFNFSKDSFRNTDDICEIKSKKIVKYEIVEDFEDFQTKDNYDFNRLEKNCKLYRDFVNGNKWINHNQFFGLCTNICRYEGGTKRLLQALENYEYTDFEKHNKKNTARLSYRVYNYNPMRCSSYCPYCSDCSNTGLNIASMELSKGEIRKIENIKYEDIEIVEKRTKEAIKFAMSEKNHSRFTLIIAPTAIGKTESYLGETIETSNVCIATPTHVLADEIYQRYNEKSGNKDDIIRTYKLDKKYSCSNKYYHLMKLGLYNEAKLLLRNFINNNDNSSSEFLKNAKLVLSNLEKTKTSSKLIITHAGMLYLDNDNINTFLIDEDILPTLITTVEYCEKDFKTVASNICGDDDLEKALLEFTRIINATEMNTVTGTPSSNINFKSLYEVIYDTKSYIKTNIFDCLTSSYFIKYLDEKGNLKIDMIKYDSGTMFNRDDCKYIMLSATANVEIYKSLFGEENIQIIDCGQVKPKGKIFLHSKFTFSRSCVINKSDEVIEYIEKSTDKNYETITFKSFSNIIRTHGFNIFSNFGSTSGLDKLAGSKINVIGTPNLRPQTYELYSYVLGINTKTESMAMRTVKRNGFEFRFFTYDNSKMRNLQFYLIESELLQAIGRARVNREQNAEVHLFSNLPVPFCELVIDLNETDYENSQYQEKDKKIA